MKDQFAFRKFQAYRLALKAPLAGLPLEQTIKLLTLVPSQNNSALSGRRSVSYAEIENFGRVVIKHFNRGGLLGHILRNVHLGFAGKRARQECEMLMRVAALGLNVPQPLGYVWKGEGFYKAWLITKEIEQNHTLAELAMLDEDAAREVMQEVIRQVNSLMQNGILHVDLHPGNVLVDSAGKVYLLDFDKAEVCNQSREHLRDNYLFRWRRAVIKHGLPEVLSETMCFGLRTSRNVYPL